MADAILGGKSDGFGTFHLCGAPDVTRLEFVQGDYGHPVCAPYTDAPVRP